MPSSFSANDVARGNLPAGVKPVPGQVYQDKLNKFRDQVRQRGDDVDENWNLVRPGGQGAPPAVAPQPAAAPPAAAPKTFDRALIPKDVSLPANSVWMQAPNGVVGHVPKTSVERLAGQGYAVAGGQ